MGGSRSRKSEVYFDELCRDIFRGLRQRARKDCRLSGSRRVESVCAAGAGEQDTPQEHWDNIS
eukprot:4082519-Lingulodinium_polyedra.AAC.1